MLDTIEQAMIMAEGVWRRMNNRDKYPLENDRKEIAGCKAWQRQIRFIADGIYAAMVEERERCAEIAKEMDCMFVPDDYRETFPGPAGMATEWEMHQCYHGDRIAEKIRANA